MKSLNFIKLFICFVKTSNLSKENYIYLLNFFLGHQRPSVPDPDSRLEVVKVLSIDLEEFNEQHSEVGVGLGGVGAGV
jgi:hypothetical protein